MTTISVRKAEAPDVPAILSMIRELAAYEREPLENVVTTEDDLLRDGFGSSPTFSVLIAEMGSGSHPEDVELRQPVGFALYFFTWSTWAGKKCVHLEDLFVRPNARKRGAGLALMRAIAKEAVDRGCARFGWQVLDWNQPAFDFYKTLGSRVLKDWVSVRLEGEALKKLAATSSSP